MLTIFQVTKCRIRTTDGGKRYGFFGRRFAVVLAAWDVDGACCALASVSKRPR